MKEALPRLHFRTRDNGAQVFRISQDGVQKRLEMTLIATANIRKGDIRPQPKLQPTEEEMQAIRSWMADRVQLVKTRETDDILRSLEHLHTLSAWVQSKASDDEVAQMSGPLLMAIHDLRSVLTRRMASQVKPDDPSGRP